MAVSGFLQRLRESRYMLRILLSFFSLLLLFMVAAFFFFGSVNESTRKMLLQKHFAEFQEKSQKLSSILNSIHINGVTLLKSNIVRGAIKPYHTLISSDRKNQQVVLSMLSDLSVLYEPVAHSYLYIEKNKVYYSTGAYDWELFFGRAHHYENFEPFWPDGSYVTFAPVFSSPTTLYMDSSQTDRVIPMSICDLSSGLVLVQDLSIEKLGQVLTEFSETYQSYYILCNGQLAFQSGGPDYAELSEIQRQKRYAVLSFQTPYSIELYSVIDLQAVDTSIEKRYEMLTFLFAGLLFLLAGLAAIASYALYRPVRRLKAVVNGGSAPKHADEFDRFALAYADVNRHCEDTQDELAHVNSSYMRSQLEMLLFFNQIPSGGMEDWFSPSEEMTLQCLCLDLKWTASFQSSLSENDGFLWAERLSSELQNDWNRKQESNRCCVISRSPENYLLLLGGLQLTQQAGADFAAALSEKLDSYGCFETIHIGVGPVHFSFKESQHSFYLAETAADLCDEAGHMQIQLAKNDYRCKIDDTQEEINRLMNLTAAGDVERLCRQTARLRESLALNGYLSNTRRHFWYSVYHRLHLLHAMDEGPLNDFFQNQCGHIAYGKYGMGGSLRQYALAVENVLCTVCRFSGQPASGGSQRIEQITLYVQGHYMENIGLSELSEIFLLSPSYLSKAFKESTGENLSDYIARCRIRIALQYLMETDLSVQEISEKVGIFSRSTFLRIFRKIAGVSPSEFKKLSEQEKRKLLSFSFPETGKHR